MDEKQYQHILEILDRIRRSLAMIQILAGITLGFLLALSFAKLLG